MSAGGTLYEADSGAATPVASLGGIGSLRGVHNAQNAAAAVAVARCLGLDKATIAKGLRTFPGLAHRMEEVGRRGRVLFVNDSKATNADAAAKALASFDRIYWIAGGRAKEGGIAGLGGFPAADCQGVSHRRGGGRVRQNHRGPCSRRGIEHARHRGGIGRARCRGGSVARVGRAPVAGLCVL